MHARRCVEKLFAFMELQKQQVVKSKLGRSHEQESLTMRHVSKSAAVVYSPHYDDKTGGTEGNHAQDVLVVVDEIREDFRVLLQSVFQHYCRFGEKDNYIYMRRGQFLKFARDSALISDSFPLISVNLLFDKMNSKSRTIGENEARLSFKEFVVALRLTAQRLYPQHTEAAPEEAFRLLMENHVMKHAHGAPQADPMGEELAQPQVLELMRAEHRQLKKIFNYYAKIDVVQGAQVSWQDVAHSNSNMSLNEFLKLAHDFDFIPNLLTKSQLTQAFRDANFGKHRSSNDTTRLNYTEYEACLGRCALMAFGWKEPEEKQAEVAFSPARGGPSEGSGVGDEEEAGADGGSVFWRGAKDLWGCDEPAGSPPARPATTGLASTSPSRASGVSGEVVRVQNPSRRRGLGERPKREYYWEAGLPVSYHRNTVQLVEQGREEEQEALKRDQMRKVWKKNEGGVLLDLRRAEREALQALAGQRRPPGSPADRGRPRARGPAGLSSMPLKVSLAQALSPSRPVTCDAGASRPR